MPEQMDYCQYYLNKCTDRTVLVLMRNTNFKTVDSIRNAYENSTCFSRNPDYRNRLLMKSVSSFIKQDSERFDSLDADASKVLQRAINRINNVSIYGDIFSALSDYLWVAVSAEICAKRRIISLTDNYHTENGRAMVWIYGLEKMVDDEKHELKCMQEADNTSFLMKLYPEYIGNPDVAWYADAKNVSKSARKQMMSECKSLIKERERIFFAFLITNLYREQLRRRYW